MDRNNSQIQIVTPEFRYSMDYKKVGKCIIINNKNFADCTGMRRRNGTDKDADDLQRCFRNIGFDVVVHNDQSCEEMEKLLKQAACENHSDAACFACIFLSHGKEDLICGIDEPMPIKILTSVFRGDKCPSLVGKPKLFFIQACRGSESDNGVQTQVELSEGSRGDPGNYRPVSLTSIPGCCSWRDVRKGSWFVQSLCSVLSKHAKQLEILQVLTRVNYKVATSYETHSKKKQIPCVVSMLTKELYF